MTSTTENDIPLRDWIEQFHYLDDGEDWPGAAAGFIVTTPAGKIDAPLLIADPSFCAELDDQSFAAWLIAHFDDEARVKPAP